MASRKLSGGCYCGAVRYEITGAPEGSMICHCRTCRRIAAAPVVAWLTVPADAFRFTHDSPRTFRSSPPVTRSFCETCGTQLAYANADDPDHVDVATCSLDRPEEAPPTHHSWLSHDLDWVKFGDGLPSFPGSRYGDAG